MRSASSLLAGGGREAAQSVLRRQIPRPGEDDPREFAWYHLWAEATRDYTFLGLAEPSSILPDPARWAERMRRGQAQPPRLSQFAEWIRIDPSGLRVHDWAGSYLLTQGETSAHLDLEEKRVWYQDDAGRQLLEGMRGRPLLSPDGRTLVLSVPDRYADVGGATPPVAERRRVRLASGSTLKVVQVPEALREGDLRRRPDPGLPGSPRSEPGDLFTDRLRPRIRARDRRPEGEQGAVDRPRPRGGRRASLPDVPGHLSRRPAGRPE